MKSSPYRPRPNRAGKAVGLLVALGCLAIAPVATAKPAGRDGDRAAIVLLQRSMLTAVAATRVDAVLRGVEGSLVYLGSEYENEKGPDREAAEARAESSTPPPSAGGGGSMPPASAGSNGTPIPPPPPGTIAVHTPVLRGAAVNGMSATYVGGVVLTPPGMPDRIEGVINAANTIVGRPYAWGGGHGSWYASGYDCSGAVSFALAGGGFLASPLDSGAFMSWGDSGPGRWVTIYASPSHAYAVIAGFRWDTVGNANGSGPRWHRAGVPPEGFVARHPTGF